MTITIGSSYQWATAGSSGDRDFNVVELTSTSFAIIYRKASNVTHQVVIGTISGTVITFGSVLSLSTTSGGTGNIAACALSSSLILVACTDTTAGNSKVYTVSVSGTTATKNSETTLDASSSTSAFSTCNLDGSKALVVYNKSGTGIVANVISISGTSCTVNSPVTLSGTASYDNSIDTLSATSAIFGYIDGSTGYPRAAVISISGTTPSIGSSTTIESTAAYLTGGGTGQKFCVASDSSTAAMCWLSQNADDLRSAAMSISGTTVTGGSVVSLDNTITTGNGRKVTLCAPTASRLVYSYSDNSTGEHFLRSAALSGTTITDNADRTALSGTNHFEGAIGAVGTGFICAFVANSYTFLLAVAEATSTGTSFLDLAANKEYLFATKLDSGTLKLFRYDHKTLTEEELDSFGSATLTNIDNGDNALDVIVNLAALNRIFVYGLDGNGVQVWYSDDNGDTFTDISGSWGSGLVVALEIDLFQQDDIIAFLDNDDIYQSIDNGATWVKITDGPGTDITHAERSPLLPEAFIVSSSVSGDLDLSVNLGDSFDDISITTGASTITKIKKAF